MTAPCRSPSPPVDSGKGFTNAWSAVAAFVPKSIGFPAILPIALQPAFGVFGPNPVNPVNPVSVVINGIEDARSGMPAAQESTARRERDERGGSREPPMDRWGHGGPRAGAPETDVLRPGAHTPSKSCSRISQQTAVRRRVAKSWPRGSVQSTSESQSVNPRT